MIKKRAKVRACVAIFKLQRVLLCKSSRMHDKADNALGRQSPECEVAVLLLLRCFSMHHNFGQARNLLARCAITVDALQFQARLQSVCQICSQCSMFA